MISYGAVGANAYSAASGTSVAPAYPSGITAGQMLVLIVGQKPTTANGGTVTTPAGWTLAGSFKGGGYGSAAPSPSAGNVNLYMFTKVAASESGSLTVTVGDNNICWAQISRFTTTSTGWGATLFASAEQTVAPTEYNSLTTASPLAIQGQDMLVFAMVLVSSANGSSTYSNHALTSGVYIGATTEIAEPLSTVGNDLAGVTGYGRVGNGSANSPVTWSSSMVLSNPTHLRGPFGVLVLRESPVVSPTSLDRVYAVESLLADAGAPVPQQRVYAVESLLVDTGTPVPQQRVYAAEAVGVDVGVRVPVQRVYAAEMLVVHVEGVEPEPTYDCWVWNGTAEVPAHVTVWNGTAEVASSLEVV